MLLIPCPWCGPRNQVEFTYGGDATREAPAADAPMRAWFDYVYLRDNPAARTTSCGCTAPAAGAGSSVRRDTRTHDILAAPASTSRWPGATRVTQPFRLAAGGIVDRARPLAFAFDGARYEGYAGDTLASALLANGVHLVARSFKYHRPRGIFTRGRRGAECAGAAGARRAHRAQRARDHAASSTTASSPRARTAGRRVALRRRRAQRRAVALLPGRLLLQDVHVAADAALVAALRARDPPRRGHGPRAARARSRPLRASAMRTATCWWSAAARRASPPRAPPRSAGARVIAVRRERGASAAACSATARTIDGAPARQWIAGAHRASWRRMPDVTLLPRTTAFGYYDGNLVGLVERVADHLAGAAGASRRGSACGRCAPSAVVLATGAHERGIAYANNDLPGTMLAGAARTYVTRYARQARNARRRRSPTTTAPTRPRWRLHDAGVAVAAIVDARPRSGARSAGRLRSARAAGLPIVAGAAIVARARQAARRRGRRSRRLAAARRTRHRMRSRLRVGRLESGRASVFAGARHAALRRCAGGVRARRLAAADRRRRRGQRALRSRRRARRRTRRRAAAAARARASRAQRRSPRPHAGRWRRGAAAAVVACPRRQGDEVLRRSAERRHRRRHRARRARRLHARSST